MNGHPVADGAGVFVIHREAREHVLDVGLQRHPDGCRHADTGGGDPGEREVFLPPQADRKRHCDDEDGDKVLHESRRIASAPLLDVAFPIKPPAQAIENHRRANDQCDGQQMHDRFDVTGRIDLDERRAEQSRGQQKQRDNNRGDHYFSVITRSMPRSPLRKWRTWCRTQGSSGNSAARASRSSSASPVGSCRREKASR